MKKQFRYYLLILAVLLFLPGITGAQPLILTPKWTAQAQFTGYYVAEKMGFFKEEGIDLQVKHPAISESSFSILQQGESQVAVMNLSFALTARAAGARVVNIMQTSQINSLMLVSRTPIKNINSLQHKKIAVWNHLSQELLDRISNHYNLQVEWIRFNGGINIFMSGAVDICLVGSYNEYLQLIECGIKPESINLARFSDYGYNLPEDGLYVTEEFYQQHPDTVRKITQACIRGWKWAYEHEEEALDIVMEIIHKNNIGSNRYHQQKMLEELFRLQKDERSGEATFHLDKEGFDMAADILLSDPEKVNIRYEDFVK